MKKKLESLAASPYFRMTEVADGVYAAICVNGSGSLGNAAIVDLGDATLVVDTTMNLSAAQDLRHAAEQLTGRPVGYVFNTHWHGDHVTGNQVFAPEARFISTGGTRGLMATMGLGRLNQHLGQREELFGELDEFEKSLERVKDEKIRRDWQWEVENEREYVKRLPELNYTVPAVTFENELTLHGSSRTVKLMSYGGGHSPSDGFVYLPEDQLLVAGDLVLSGFHPTMFNGNPWEWMKILDRIAELEFERIIPGHGEVCAKNSLFEVREYISYMIELAGSLGEGEDAVESAAIPAKYDDWLFRPEFRNNLNRLRELSGGEQPS